MLTKSRRFFHFVFLLLPGLFCIGSAHWIDLHTWYDHISVSPSHPTANVAGSTSYIPELTNNKSITNYGTVQNDINSFSNANLEGMKEERKLPGCRELGGILSEAQIHICQLFHDHMSSLVQGAKLGLTECRWQFRYHQWNCSALGIQEKPKSVSKKSIATISSSSSSRSKKSSSFPMPHKLSPSSSISSLPASAAPVTSEPVVDWNSLVNRGSKEVAFAHAVWAAAVTQSIARSCRDGSLTSCGCGKTVRPTDLKNEWRWGGCGDNLQYGYKFSQNFVDSREQEKVVQDKREKTRILANLHNNEAGRRSVLKKTKVACKCHGVSGSCALVTCWHQVPSFREIGDHLKERYARATLVKLNKRGRLQVKKSGDPVPSVYDLVYAESSPNYCHRNDSLGVFGTTGRVCNRTSTAPDSCKNLCCNRGYTTKVIKSANRCKCKFIWCCQVVCEECSRMQKFDVCK